MRVMFLGTSSGAGKTTVTALYCRYLHKKNVNVAPFKASNLSLNSFATKDGKEIGMGQAFQAWASNVEPISDMNPILLKPTGNGTIQLMINGEAVSDVAGRSSPDNAFLLTKATESFDRLAEKHDAIVCEGSGSPVELNLIDRDIANIGIVRKRNIPAVLVADIERGGAFAALYGTWYLMPEDVRPLVKGFIMNRFRGDPTILKEATDKIVELTGMKFLGIIPHMELKFPEEDSLSEINGKLEGSNVKEAFMNNLDELLENAILAGLDLGSIEEISRLTRP